MGRSKYAKWPVWFPCTGEAVRYVKHLLLWVRGGSTSQEVHQDALHIESEVMGGRGETWYGSLLCLWLRVWWLCRPPAGASSSGSTTTSISHLWTGRLFALVGSCLWISDTDGLRRPRPSRRRGTMHSTAELASRKNANRLCGVPNSKMAKKDKAPRLAGGPAARLHRRSLPGPGPWSQALVVLLVCAVATCRLAGPLIRRRLQSACGGYRLMLPMNMLPLSGQCQAFRGDRVNTR